MVSHNRVAMSAIISAVLTSLIRKDTECLLKIFLTLPGG